MSESRLERFHRRMAAMDKQNKGENAMAEQEALGAQRELCAAEEEGLVSLNLQQMQLAKTLGIIGTGFTLNATPEFLQAVVTIKETLQIAKDIFRPEPIQQNQAVQPEVHPMFQRFMSQAVDNHEAIKRMEQEQADIKEMFNLILGEFDAMRRPVVASEVCASDNAGIMVEEDEAPIETPLERVSVAGEIVPKKEKRVKSKMIVDPNGVLKLVGTVGDDETPFSYALPNVPYRLRAGDMVHIDWQSGDQWEILRTIIRELKEQGLNVQNTHTLTKYGFETLMTKGRELARKADMSTSWLDIMSHLQ